MNSFYIMPKVQNVISLLLHTIWNFFNLSIGSFCFRFLTTLFPIICKFIPYCNFINFKFFMHFWQCLTFMHFSFIFILTNLTVIVNLYWHLHLNFYFHWNSHLYLRLYLYCYFFHVNFSIHISLVYFCRDYINDFLLDLIHWLVLEFVKSWCRTK